MWQPTPNHASSLQHPPRTHVSLHQLRKTKHKKFIKAIKSNKTMPTRANRNGHHPDTTDATQPRPTCFSSQNGALNPPQTLQQTQNTRSQMPPSDPNIQKPPYLIWVLQHVKEVIQHGNNPNAHTDREHQNPMAERVINARLTEDKITATSKSSMRWTIPPLSKGNLGTNPQANSRPTPELGPQS